MPVFPSIAAWARLAARSSRHIRLSIAIEAFISRITSAGPLANRPPHILLELPVRVILLFLALLAVAGCDRQKPDAQQGEAAGVPVAGVKRGVDRSHKGEAAPDVAFFDPDDGEISLADFRGVPVLVNLWASWCAPCIKELPTLGKLEESHALDGQMGVIAVSQDMAPKASVDAFVA